MIKNQGLFRLISHFQAPARQKLKRDLLAPQDRS